MEDTYSLDETIKALNDFEFVEGFLKSSEQVSVMGYQHNKQNISLDVWAPMYSGQGNALGGEKDRVRTGVEAVSELKWLNENYGIVNIFEESRKEDEFLFRVQTSQLADDIWYKAPSDRPKKDITEQNQTDEWKYPVEEV
jgi:hypothetical protein